MDWDYWKGKDFGYAKSGAGYLTRKAGDAGRYVWAKTKQTARDKAAQWNAYLASDEYKAAKKAGDKAKVWAIWAKDNGVKLGKKGYRKEHGKPKEMQNHWLYPKLRHR